MAAAPAAPQASADPVLPQALRRSAYDAPNWGSAPPPELLDPAMDGGVGYRAAKTPVAFTPNTPASDAMRSAQPAPPEKASAAIPPQILTFKPVDDGYGEPPEVPPAPQLARGSYQPRTNIEDELAAIEDTPSGAPVATTTKSAPPSRLGGQGAPVPKPAQSAPTPNDDFNGQTVSVMPSEAKEKAEEAASRMAQMSKAGGGYGLHLASYQRAEKAEEGWDILQEQYADLLTSLSARGHAVDLPGKGRYIRLIAGPFPTEGEAESRCAAFEERDEYCVVRPFQGEPIL